MSGIPEVHFRGPFGLKSAPFKESQLIFGLESRLLLPWSHLLTSCWS